MATETAIIKLFLIAHMFLWCACDVSLACTSDLTKSATLQSDSQHYTSVETPQDNSSTDGRRMYKSLIQRLEANSHPSVPPNADNLTNPVQIDIVFKMHWLDSLRDQVMKAHNTFYVSWLDPSLCWDTSEYHVDTVMLDNHIIWRPEISLKGNFEESDRFMKHEAQVSVSHTGRVSWVYSEITSTTCVFFIRLFPFDRQFCTFSLGSFTQSWKAVSLNVKHAVRPKHQQHEWDVLDIRWGLQNQDADGTGWILFFEVEVKRRWGFYVTNILLPVLLICGLNNVVLLLPAESGEKVSVSLTTFLTLAVYMTIVMETLPSNSNTVCYLALFLSMQMILGVIGVVLAVVAVKCQLSSTHTVSKEDVPEVLSDSNKISHNCTDQLENNVHLGSSDPNNPVVKMAATRVGCVTKVGNVINRYGVPVFVSASVLSTLTFFLLVSMADEVGYLQPYLKEIEAAEAAKQLQH